MQRNTCNADTSENSRHTGGGSDRRREHQTSYLYDMKISTSIANRCTLVVLVCALLLVSGCSSALNIFSGPLTVRLQGQEDMNGGNAARVHIFELAGETNFRTATVSKFWRDTKGTLGGELINAREELLYPNETKTVEFEVAEKTKFIGIAANLRNPDREQWRSIHPVEEVKGEEIAVTVGVDRVQVRVQ